ncbi:MAG: BlaI/MecI/CopY family transcriptional regulator [Peptococcaceae bacterium]|nr:BlaI/MecI/CopY family transcriptional regulator [Peptococcaceae bacterium]
MSSIISDAEFEVMRVLWQGARPLSFTEIRKELEGKTEWSRSTIQTLISRLRDKGIVDAQFQHVMLYSALLSEQEYIQIEEQGFLDKLFDGDAMNFVAGLCRNGRLSEKDIDKLKSFFTLGGDKK